MKCLPRAGLKKAFTLRKKVKPYRRIQIEGDAVLLKLADVAPHGCLGNRCRQVAGATAADTIVSEFTVRLINRIRAYPNINKAFIQDADTPLEAMMPHEDAHESKNDPMEDIR